MSSRKSHSSDISARNDDVRSEPADPPVERIDHDARTETRLAPRNLVNELPDPFVECGCGECHDVVDPLSEHEVSVNAADVCDSPQPVTLQRAREIYIRYIRSSWMNSDFTSKYERHRRNWYPRILQSDRELQRTTRLTTVMLTRRLSPTDESGSWTSPVKLDEMLNGGEVRDSVQKAIRYHLKEHNHSYVAVTAPTETAATPHEHIYLWIDDPEDEISVAHFEPALEKHLKYCPRAYAEDHQYADDGSEGAITVRHDPLVVDEEPEKVEEIKKKDVASQSQPDDYARNTRGAQYIASQLAHLPLGERFNGQVDNPALTMLEGGAISWASNYDWVRTSQGLPGTTYL